VGGAGRRRGRVGNVGRPYANRPLKGTLITGDAAFTQRDLCAAVVLGEGDYFLTVKDNQPTLEADIRAAFGPAFSPPGAAAAGHRGRPGRDPR